MTIHPPIRPLTNLKQQLISVYVPGHIRNAAKYFDRCWQWWHAAHLPTWHAATDIDLYGYCAKCNAPLYISEGSETRDHKMGPQNELARRLHVPCILVRHNSTNLVEWRVTAPEHLRSDWQTDLEILRALFHRIRGDHDQNEHYRR